MTSCISARELSDETLLAYLHGEADEQVALHLSECPHCQKLALDLARFHDSLTSRLYRLDCPAPAHLGEYHLEMLSQKETESVAQHLKGCAHCTQEIALLETYLQDLAPDLEPGFIEQVRERTRVLLAGLSRGGTLGRQSGQLAPARGKAPQRKPGQPALTPAFAGIRGGETAPQVYEAEEITVAIESQLDAGHPGRWIVLGLVIGFDAGAAAEALLWLEGRRLASSAVSETGSFDFGDLAPGAYDLVLCAGPVEVHIRDVQVGGGEGGHGRSGPD